MYLKYILSIFILVTTLFSNSYEVIERFDIEDKSTNISKIVPVNIVKTEINKTDKKAKPPLKHKKAIVKKEIKKLKSNSLKKETKKFTKKSKRAKLVIIIDDISHKYQLETIKKLPFKVTPSIFPPTKMNMQSFKLARGLKHFMVHLPLESNSRQMNKIYKIIHINDSKAKILKRVKEIRKYFPNAKYINNHTGSKFSANYKASKGLYKALIDNGFIFVDSRTSKNTKFKKIAKEYGKRYLKSDLFIDNKLSLSAIKQKIKEGVNLAKKRGYAVIIGHPHPQTLKALKQSAKLINSVKTVYIDEL